MTGGHGHVTPRPDGAKARCGGPALCGECAKELAAQTAGRPSPGGEPVTVYASIGNSDDKLSQQRWHEFWVAFRNAVTEAAARVHGEWLSIGCAPYQNACICADIPAAKVADLKACLAELAADFRQDSIAWAEARTEFIGPEHGQAGRLRGRGRR